MDHADETVAKWLTLKSDSPYDEQPIKCGGCGGCPVDDGALFVSVVGIVGGKRHHGWMCELCYLKRLQRRAHYVNISSGPMYQIDMPDLDIRRERRPEPPRRKPDPRRLRMSDDRASVSLKRDLAC